MCLRWTNITDLLTPHRPSIERKLFLRGSFDDIIISQ